MNLQYCFRQLNEKLLPLPFQNVLHIGLRPGVCSTEYVTAHIGPILIIIQKEWGIF